MSSIRLELVGNDTIELECDALDESMVSCVIAADESNLDDFSPVSPTRLRFSTHRFRKMTLASFTNAFKSVKRSTPEFQTMRALLTTLETADRMKTCENDEEIRYPSAVSKLGFAYQLEDIKRAIHEFQGRFLLASEPGTGKTMVTLAIASHYGGKTLIVCPASLKENWRRECVRWTPERRVKIIKTDADEFNPDSFDVLIVSYTLAGASPLPPKKRKTRWNNNAAKRFKTSSSSSSSSSPTPRKRKKTLENLRSIQWTTMVCDESHNLSNSTTQMCKNLGPMMRAAPRLVLISGTPMSCRPSQLWVQFSSVFSQDPAIKLWDERGFQLRYCDAHFNHVFRRWDSRGESRMFELHSLLKTRIIRRFQNEVLGELPPLTRHEVRLQIAPHEMEEYRLAHSHYEDLKRRFELERDPRKKAALSREFDPAYTAKYRATCKAKIEASCTYVAESLSTNNEKILVFAHHAVMISALESRLRDIGIKFVTITGKTPADKRQSIIDELVSNPEIRVGILGIIPGCTGLNITPTVTRVIFVEFSFVPSNHLQAEARVHRIGCIHPIRSEYLLAKETMDDELLQRLFAKFAVNDSVLDNGRNADDFAMDSTHHIEFDGTVLSKYGVRHHARRCKVLPLPTETVHAWISRVAIPVPPSRALIADFRSELRSTNDAWCNGSDWVNLLERDNQDLVRIPDDDEDPVIETKEEEENERSFFWIVLGDCDLAEISAIRAIPFPHERAQIVAAKRIVAVFASHSLVSRATGDVVGEE